MHADEILALREMSGFPLSIGTGLAFESLFTPTAPVYDPERTPPDRIQLSNYTQFGINVETLYRNLCASVSKEHYVQLRGEDLLSALTEELMVIRTLIETHAPTTKLTFYHNTFHTLRNFVKRQSVKVVSLRDPKTDQQKAYDSQAHQVLKALKKDIKDLVEVNDTPSFLSNSTSLVLTHYPYDLSKPTGFSQVSLLESNTGAVKPRAEWNTKYLSVGEEKLTLLPFHRRLLLLFGDRALIRPSFMPMRKKVIEIAKTRNWTPLTGLEKVKLDFEVSIRDPVMAAAWNSLSGL